MKISLIGVGKTGAQILDLANKRGLEVVNIFNRKNPISASLLKGTVSIDFTTPQAFVEHYELLFKHSLAVVIGTTGWEGWLARVEETCLKFGARGVYSSNFSIGMTKFFKILGEACRYLAPYDYKAYLLEKHHQHKKDRPSGTAINLQKILAKHNFLTTPESIRCGEIIGMHEVGFESEYDQILLRHNAYSRDGFASGALWAAEAILKAKENKLYAFEELL